MISFLRGKIVSSGEAGTEIDVAGVGYFLHTPPSAAAGFVKGETVTIPVHLIVREDALTLYGFKDALQRESFRLLLGAGGVGPKLALAVVSFLSSESLRRAIVTGDVVQLTSVPGVGKRVAERIVMELRPKFATVGDQGAGGGKLAAAREALVSLGYAPGEAAQALEGADENLRVEDLVKSALRELSPR